MNYFILKSYFCVKLYCIMKKIILFFACVFFVNVEAQQRPKLVVGIVVDQMKMEYLYRFFR